MTTTGIDTEKQHRSTTARMTAVAASALLALAGTASIMSLTGCNTTKGMGEDIESLGDSISDEADEAKN